MLCRFQFPPWFVTSARAYAWLELVLEKFPDHHLAEELKRWADKVKRASKEADKIFIIFNNCYENYGIKNAKTLQAMLNQP
ncbi:MAG: DUF72 domain-containing protein [Desulfobacterales bacterium]|nr:DUF72 domain-containing protein [Desulfobacterales bacterium]